MIKILVAFALATIVCMFVWMGSADSSQSKVKGWTCLSIPSKVIKGKTVKNCDAIAHGFTQADAEKAANAKCVTQCAALACRATACGGK